MSKIAEPKYSVIEKNGNIEVRSYESMIVAEVEVTGTRSEAIRNGFRKIANYIFGDNSEEKKISMTAPVRQKKTDYDDKKWHVSFVMPFEYDLKDLPIPNEVEVKFVKIVPKKMIAIQFSGFATDKNIQENLKKINNFIEVRHKVIVGEPIFAFYNPPWTLPFLRRNEIMIELQS